MTRIFPLLALLLALPAAAADRYETERAAMVRTVAESAVQAGYVSGVEKLDERVMQAMGKVPRHRYVPADLWGYAYDNRPLPIGYGQTISQPYIVALMTHLMNPQPGHRILEIGTGSGYQAAILAELAHSVYTIEIIEPLGLSARRTLADNGVRNVTVRIGDGYYGWSDAAPFDGIVVTAAASHIPSSLVKQLKPGGRMVIPVGAQFLTQQLVLVEKNRDGGVTTRQLLPVRFVPLTGGH